MLRLLHTFRDAGCEAERLLAKYGIAGVEIPAVLTSGIIDDLAERERRELNRAPGPSLHELLKSWTGMNYRLSNVALDRLETLLKAIVDELEADK